MLNIRFDGQNVKTDILFSKYCILSSKWYGLFIQGSHKVTSSGSGLEKVNNSVNLKVWKYLNCIWFYIHIKLLYRQISKYKQFLYINILKFTLWIYWRWKLQSFQLSGLVHLALMFALQSILHSGSDPMEYRFKY